MPTYQKNYLTEVILRIDFLEPYENFRNSIDKDLDDLIVRSLPIKESKDTIVETVNISNQSDKVSKNQDKFCEWNYYQDNKKTRLCLTKDFLFIDAHAYENFVDFTFPINQILNYLNENHVDIGAKRIGLRYINNIHLDEPRPFSWNNYLNSDLLSIFRLAENKNDIRRAFHVLEFLFQDNDVYLKFQYGMHNPDYPAPIRQKLFVLDFDSFKQGELNIDEMLFIMPILHEHIENLFEKSIKDRLREMMNG